MEPSAVVEPGIEARARKACQAVCRRSDLCAPFCERWTDFVTVARQEQLEAVSLRAGRPVALADFDVVAGPTDAAERLRAANGMRRVDLPMAGAGFSFVEAEPAVEAPRPPALPEHPAIEITLALRRASAMDRQWKIAAQLLVDLGVSDQTFDDAARRHDMELGGVGFHESRKGILGAEARAVFDAVLAEILA